MSFSEKATQALHRKVGPLEVWQWGGIGLGVVAVYLVVLRQGSSGGTVQPITPADTIPGPDTSASPGGGSGRDGGSPAPVGPVGAVTSDLGIPDQAASGGVVVPFEPAQPVSVQFGSPTGVDHTGAAPGDHIAFARGAGQVAAAAPGNAPPAADTVPEKPANLITQGIAKITGVASAVINGTAFGFNPSPTTTTTTPGEIIGSLAPGKVLPGSPTSFGPGGGAPVAPGTGGFTAGQTQPPPTPAELAQANVIRIAADHPAAVAPSGPFVPRPSTPQWLAVYEERGQPAPNAQGI